MMPFINLSVIIALFLYASYASFTTLEPMAQTEQGYNCGRVFFTDKMINEAFAIAFTNKKMDTVKKYVGPLYEKEKEYFVWPIVVHKSSGVVQDVPSWLVWKKKAYQIVFDKNVKVIDLIVMLANYDFAKCTRVDSSQPEAQENIMEQISGFYCGDKLITSEHLRVSTNYARQYMVGGRLSSAFCSKWSYDEELGYMLWPIYRGQNLYQRPKRSRGLYFIVIDVTGQLRDVIVRTKDNDFVRCVKSRDVPSVSPPIVLGGNSATPPTSGFICNNFFFSDDDLKLASQMAKNTRIRNKHSTYPKRYDGRSFDSPCLLWPISPYGRQLGPGRQLPYRLVLTLEFKIMSVVMQSKDRIMRCERKTELEDLLNHDKNDYLCSGKIFYHNELVLTAESACKKVKTRNGRFPRPYDEDNFDVKGPYFIYPLIKGSLFKYHAGNYRVVFNYKCEVAGAIIKNVESEKHSKCEVIKST